MVEVKSVLANNPLLHDAVAARELSGISGAEIFLLTQDGRHWFVRKAAGHADGNARLRSQAVRQTVFAQKLDEVVRVPRILDEGEIEGRFYFDMAFVRGVDGASYLRSASFAEVKGFAQRLSEYLSVAATEPALSAQVHPNIFEAFYAKICEVQRKGVSVSDAVLAKLMLTLDRLRVLGDVRPTLCHGDLTLENMVIDAEGTIWVLDLLDSPFEHYWQDVAKLHQDLAGAWFFRNQPPIARYVLDYVSRHLMQATVALHDVYRDIHWLLLACTFARILPYARTRHEADFIVERLEYFVDQITL